MMHRLMNPQGQSGEIRPGWLSRLSFAAEVAGGFHATNQLCQDVQEDPYNSMFDPKP